MGKPFVNKRYAYNFNKESGEVIYPQIFLLDKRFHKLGEIYPVSDLNVIVNLNDSDEISFSCSKYYNGKPNELYAKLKPLCVVFVKGFGMFEITVKENDNKDGAIKAVTGRSLANSELSNLSATLEINTPDDIARTDYDYSYPTVFYREIPISGGSEKQKKLRESSLLHRVLTYAPHYKIGHVDDTLKYVQKTFSWKSTSIQDVLNDISEEVGCIFTYDTYLDDSGKAVRIMNAYDINYCEKCYNEALGQVDSGYKNISPSRFRSITNGICDHCGSSKFIYDYGEDTDIFVTTENLSEEMTLEPVDEVKNVYSLEGGDDLITATVQGLNMSASNKLVMMSEETQNQFSPGLLSKYKSYNEEYAAMQPHYMDLLMTEYNIIDLIQYLQSGKMPSIEYPEKTIHEEVDDVVYNLNNDWQGNFFISSYNGLEGFTSARNQISSSVIRNLFELYLDPGFSCSVTNGDLSSLVLNPDNKIIWNGTIKIYSTDDKDNSYGIIHCFSDGRSSYVEYPAENNNKNYLNFNVKLGFGEIVNRDENGKITSRVSLEYESYIRQYCEKLKKENDLIEYANERDKNWQDWCYERLHSFLNGYQSCIEALDGLSIQDFSGTAQNMADSYRQKMKDISQQMQILAEQINALYEYYGSYYTSENPGYKDYVSSGYRYQIFSGFDAALKSLVNSSVYHSNTLIGTAPIMCKICGSSNVGVDTDGNNVCKNYQCSASGSDLTTYHDIAKQVSDFCSSRYNGKSILKERTEIQNRFDLKVYFGEYFSEFYSFFRETDYCNENYISDNLNNQQIAERAKELQQKATSKLAQTCVQQYALSSKIAAIVTSKWKCRYKNDSGTYTISTEDAYDKFKPGNWIRARINHKSQIEKMRIMSIQFDFSDITNTEVTFSNITKDAYGGLSDINSVLSQVGSLASSIGSVSDQANQGALAKDWVNRILNEGLNSALTAVLGAKNQDIVIDEHGITLRQYNTETEDYSPYQMKMINRNIVMTDDNWEHAKLAIGLGTYNGQDVYGVWADLLVGKLIVGEQLLIADAEGTVEITGSGITLDGGKITWKSPISQNAVNGLPAKLTELDTNITEAKRKFERDINAFKTNVKDVLGIGTTEISSDSVISPKIGGGYLYITSGNTSVEINPALAYYEGRSGKIFNIRSAGADVFTVNAAGDGVFSGEVNATSGTFSNEIKTRNLKLSGSVSIWDGNNGFSVSPTGINFQCPTVTSPDNPVVRMRITNEENYFLAPTTKIFGDAICLGIGTGSGTFHPVMELKSSGTDRYSVETSNQTLLSTGDIFSKTRLFVGDVQDWAIEGNVCEKKGIYLAADGFIRTIRSQNVTSELLSATFRDAVPLIGWSSSNNVHVGGNITSGEMQWPDRIILHSKTVQMLNSAGSRVDIHDVTSDERQKNIHGDIPDSTDFIMSLKPVVYNYNSEDETVVHWGFGAQTTLAAMNKCNMGESCLVKRNPYGYDSELDINDDSTFFYSMNNMEMIPPVVSALQKALNKIEELEKRIFYLESR